MTITGQIGHIGFGRQAGKVEETDLASYAAGDLLKDWFVITDESLAADNNPITAEGEIGRGRDLTGAIAGGYGITGGFGGNARVEDLAKLVCAAVSNDDSMLTQSATGNEGIITPTNYLDWFVIEKNVGDTLYVWYVNCKLNTLTISVNSNEMATYSTEWVASMEKTIAEGVAGSPDYTEDDILAFHGGLLKIGGIEYRNMESVEISIENDLSDDEYTVQPSRFLNDVTEGSRKFTLNFNQVFQNADDYSTYTYGEVGRTTPGYKLYEESVTFLLMNDQVKGTATEYIEFEFPRVMFGGLPVTLTSGRITVANVGDVFAPKGAGDIMTVTFL